jgi:hypothetical protein
MGEDKGRIRSLFVWLVADSWCWFVLREKYCWLVVGDWFSQREKSTSVFLDAIRVQRLPRRCSVKTTILFEGGRGGEEVFAVIVGPKCIVS